MTIATTEPGNNIVTKKKVFIVSDGSHDYSLAKKHGDLELLLRDKINVFASDKLYRDIEDVLKGASPDDFLILSGNMLAAAMAFQVMMKFHGKVNVLIYSFRNEQYEIRTVRGDHEPLSHEDIEVDGNK